MAFPDLHPLLSEALAARGYDQPTPVQERVVQPEASGRDLLVSAQTGSGKTIAYGLAMGETLLPPSEPFPQAGEPMALVVAPTRELALQVSAELSWLYGHTRARIVSCVGGMDPRAERRRLAEGAHIVVGTPGRLRDHLERGALEIGALRALVLDEADEMLNLGFREDLEFLLEATPSERRTLLFSATLPKAIVAMTKRYQRQALSIEVARATEGHADIEYRCLRIAPNEMEHAIVNLLRLLDSPSAIVFCNTRESVRHLHSTLVERGFSAVTLSGELGQAERNRAVQALKEGQARVCVATDVAARGLDLPSLGLVIHAELPSDTETLQHRSGRTGRAGRKGVSALMVPISRRKKAERLLGEAGITAAWSGPPTAEEIRRLDEERLLADPILSEEPTEEERAGAEALLARTSPEMLAVALSRMHRARLPAPEEVFDPGFGPDPKANRDGRREEAETGRRAGPRGDGVWFQMDVGRRNNADPKWLLPLLCRRGRISRREIGAIRIFDRETKVEIAAEVADRFADAAAVSEGDDITITRAEGGPGAKSHDHRGGRAQKAFHRKQTGGEERRAPGAKSGKPPRSGPPKSKRETKGGGRPRRG